MPAPRRGSAGTTVKRTTSANGGAPDAAITAQEAAIIRAGIGGKEIAPSTRVSSVFSNWREVADQLGDPFEKERIPLSKLRQMRRDPMLAFGLSFTTVPHIRNRWHMNAVSNSGPNAQIAAHADENWRRIHASFVAQFMNSLAFGFQAVAKRFEFRIPAGTYLEVSETGEPTEQPIWSEGGIEPIAFKPFVALRPEGVEPIWDKSTGEFFGIEYSPTGGDNTGQATSGGGGSGAGAASGGAGGTNKEEVFKIDLPHALWITNEKDANFGSIFGYPRLGYAYSYWWSYWFRWAIADRAFERKADPSVIVYHPDGEFLNEETGERMSHSEYALLMGDRMRSGGVIALPSEVYEDANGRGTMRQWEIDFTKDAVNFQPFDSSFEYLDIQKLRALAVPEQAFLEGKGGTSSRNVQEGTSGVFFDSQEVLSKQISDHINRYILPQWLAANYPEFIDDGGKVEIVIQGFGEEDKEFMLQVIQLLGQQESGSREIAKLLDLKKIFEDRGMPLVSFAEQQRREADIIAEQQAQIGPGPAPAGTPAAPGTSIIPSPTGTGFSYITPREVIQLADSGTDFIQNLPGTKHFEDNAIKGFARQLWVLFRQLYRDEYATAAAAILAASDVELSDEDLQLASKRVDKLLEKWKGSAKWGEVLTGTQEILRRIMKRATDVEASRLIFNETQIKVPGETFDGWLVGHLPEMVGKAAETCRKEIEIFLKGQIEEGIVDPKELSRSISDHFSDFPQWKADRLVRTEVTEAYNAATLYSAQAIGARVQGIDNQGPNPFRPDPECQERHGKIFDPRDAFKERDHPNGTLGWRIIPVNLSIETSHDEGFQGAEFDDVDKVLTLSADLDEKAKRQIITETVEFMCRA